MSPTPVVQFPNQGQGQHGQVPQSPVYGMSHMSWQQQSGVPPQTPVSSREPRLYSSPVAGQGHSGRTPPYSQGTPLGTSHAHPASMGQQGTPPRMDMSYGQRGSMGQPVPSSPMVQTPPQTVGAGATEQELIEHAASTTDRLMNNTDLRCPSLYNSLIQAPDPNLQIAGVRPISGLMDHDYPPVMQQRIVTENLYNVEYQAPIPPELKEMISQGDAKTCYMGIFAEIFRAWMTIESDLYMWDFRDGSDLSFYDGLKEPIITMSLIPAKPNVFVSSINHLLCVTTASEISILGFVLTDPTIPMSPSTQVLELVPQPIFVLPSDNHRFVVVHGTKSGRIFLGATNGSIHEVGYQAGRGWFQDRCWKKDLSSGYFSSLFKFMNAGGQADAVIQIVSDDERNILYTRNVSGALYAYDLGADGAGFKCIGSVTMDGIRNEVVKISKKTLEPNLVTKVLKIAPVQMGEVGLIAILESGSRLYFTCYDPIQNASRDPNSTRPNALNLFHVRLPPGHCPATAQKRPAAAHMAFASSGTLALATYVNQDADCLWLISPLLYPTPGLSEVLHLHSLGGRTVAIDMIRNTDHDLNIQRVPDIVTQHLKWQKQIVVLTSTGSIVFRASKPYEILRSTLEERNGPENIKGHFDLGFGREYPLSNSLLLAIHPFDRPDNAVYEMAVKALFLYGTYESQQQSFDGGRMQSPHDRSLDFNPNLVSTPRQDGQQPNYVNSEPQSFVSPPVAGNVYTPGVNQQHMYGASAQMQQSVQGGQWCCSPRHDAIYLVVGRILYEFWHRPLVITVNGDEPYATKVLVPNIKGEEVTHATAFLHSILVFLNETPSLSVSRTPVYAPMSLSEGRQLQMNEFERNSLAALKSFISMSLEVLGMWKILCDHQFHIVLQGLDERLLTTTMRQLVVNGQNTVSVIINALISKYLGDNAAVDAISLRLREVCPTLFRNEDAIGSKVAEILAKVRNIPDPSEKEALLKESLVLSEKISGHSRVNISNFCRQYGELGFPVGAVRLVVSSAKAADPENQAINSVKGSSTDPATMRAYQARNEIYKVVFDMLDKYVTIATSAHSPVSRPKDDGLQPDQAKRLADETLHAILSSDDEVFHITLYNWLLERKLFDRLLEIKHGYLDSFLQRAAEAVTTGKWPGGNSPANDTRVLDLLWRHHEMNNNHSAAAQILSKLAESTTTGLNLQQRLEYLSRAIMCCKSTSRRGDLLEILEDKLDVARIQKSILDSVTTRYNTIMSTRSIGDNPADLKTYEDAIEKLNSQLMNITQLYSEFAHPLKLHEAKLEIFHAAGHADRKAIDAVWADIIESELSISNRSGEVHMNLLRRKLVSIGKKYAGSPSFFPLEYLIEHLEIMKPADTDDIGWVYSIMSEVGVTFWDILLIYERLWRKLNSKENARADEMKVAKSIIHIVDLFASNLVDFRNVHHLRLELLEKCKHLIAQIMVEFTSRTDDTRHIRMLLDRVQDKLDKYSV